MSKELLLLKNFYLAAFESTHTALQSEKLLQEHGLPFIIVPTPREISVSCGLAIKFKVEDCPEIEAALNKVPGSFEIYQVNREEKNNNQIKKIT